MKLLILVTFSIISFNSFASNIDISRYNYSINGKTINAAGLDKAEVNALESASNAKFIELFDCVLYDNETNIINETSCINDIFGDVHN